MANKEKGTAMADISRRRFVMIGGAAAAGAAAMAGLAACGSGNSGSTQASTSAETSAATSAPVTAGGPDVTSMTWDEILEAAKGDTVTFVAWGSGGADPYVQMMWEDLAVRVKEAYDVTLEYTEFDQTAYQKLSTDIEEGLDATYDLFWYMGAYLAPLRAIDGLYADEWTKKLPNYKYLDMTNPFNQFDGVLSVDNMEDPFQTVQPSLVYSGDKWNHKLAWDAEEDGKKGLFHNFAELQQWAAANPGQFTYMSLTGQGSFHGTLFLLAVLAELTSDGNGGWKPVYDEADDAATRHKKIQANIDDWFAWGSSEGASEEAFYEKADYVWAYLNELAPNLRQKDGAPDYMDTAPDMRQYVIAGDLAVVFTTCTSVSTRVADSPADYPSNPAIYMLQTSIGSWDYLVIMANSAHKPAAMAVANMLLDPDFQAFAFETDGNGYTVSYDLLDDAQKKTFDSMFEAMGTLTPTAEEIQLQSYVNKLGAVSAWLGSGWDQFVNTSGGAAE